jgi:hypothetical protein
MLQFLAILMALSPPKPSLWLTVKKAFLKRIADFLEKLAAGSFLIGIFQFNISALILGFAFLSFSCFFTFKYDNMIFFEDFYKKYQNNINIYVKDNRWF